MRRDREAQLRDSRARQHGLITTAQAVAIGLSQPAVSRRLAAGQWIAVLPGVHCAVDAVPTLYQRLLAAVLWAGDGAVISYRAAGALWGLDVDAGARPEIWTPRHLRHDDVIVHRGVVEPQDIRMVERIPVTSVPRTLIDLAGRLDGEELETILEQALHRGLTTLGALHRRVEALSGKGRAGSNDIRRLLNERGNSAALESRLEVRVWNLLRRAGLRPARQYPVQCGGRRYRLDFAWPALRVAVESRRLQDPRRPMVRSPRAAPRRSCGARLANRAGHMARSDE